MISWRTIGAFVAGTAGFGVVAASCGAGAFSWPGATDQPSPVGFGAAAGAGAGAGGTGAGGIGAGGGRGFGAIAIGVCDPSSFATTIGGDGTRIGGAATTCVLVSVRTRSPTIAIVATAAPATSTAASPTSAQVRERRGSSSAASNSVIDAKRSAGS